MATRSRRGEDSESWRFPKALMHAAARMYSLEDATQAEVAERLARAARRSAGC